MLYAILNVDRFSPTSLFTLHVTFLSFTLIRGSIDLNGKYVPIPTMAMDLHHQKKTKLQHNEFEFFVIGIKIIEFYCLIMIIYFRLDNHNKKNVIIKPNTIKMKILPIDTKNALFFP